MDKAPEIIIVNAFAGQPVAIRWLQYDGKVVATETLHCQAKVKADPFKR